MKTEEKLHHHELMQEQDLQKQREKSEKKLQQINKNIVKPHK